MLVGLTVAESRLFSAMPWEKAWVMDETRARLRKLEWHWRELETLWDVDRPEDYEGLRSTGSLWMTNISCGSQRLIDLLASSETPHIRSSFPGDATAETAYPSVMRSYEQPAASESR